MVKFIRASSSALMEDGQGIMVRIDSVVWIFTSTCNLRCPHCYASRFSKYRELSLGEKLRLVDEMIDVGVEYVGLSGGEPLINRDLPHILRKLCEANIEVRIVTNATYMPQEVLSMISKYGIHLYISVDGPKHIHERLRGVGTFDKIIENVKKLKDLGIHFSTVMAVNKLNYKYVSDFVKLSMDLGADYAILIPVMPSGRAKEYGLSIDAASYTRVLRIIDRISDGYGYNISLWCTPYAPLIIKSKYVSSHFCRSLDIVDMAPDGSLLICDILDLVLSNAHEKGFRRALEEYLTSDVIHYVVKPPKLPRVCVGCPIARYCRGGCFARAYIEFGDFNAGDPLCPLVSGISLES